MKHKELEQALGVEFREKALLEEALTHRSYLNEHPDWPYPHNERLEFLGDAVLELSVSDELFRLFPKHHEGQLTVLRAALVNYQLLSRIASSMKLDTHIAMSKGERADTSKARDVILANAFEAVLGAIYVDQGYASVDTVVKRCVVNHLPEILKNKSYRDAKSELQEIVQERLKVTPTYRVLEENGPPHKRTFRIGVYFGDQLIAEGSGMSKQEGEVEAAKNALKKTAR